MYLAERRCVILLEVLIAFALVALCALPLIYPHVFVLKTEKAFAASVQLDHAVNLLFANRLEKLYQNKIDWSDIESGKELPIDSIILDEIGFGKNLPYIGSYRFEKKDHKPHQPIENSVYLFKMIFTFLPSKAQINVQKGDSLTYEYQIVIEKKHQ